MLSPARTAFRKCFKSRIHGNAYSGVKIEHGEYALKATEPARMTSAQIEACRKVISRTVNKQGKMWIRVFPHMIVSKKPADTRMGGGKGGLDRYIARIYPGKVVFELYGVPFNVVEKAFKLAADKLPFATKVVKKLEGVECEY